jgi:hypothetical protein
VEDANERDKHNPTSVLIPLLLVIYHINIQLDEEEYSISITYNSIKRRGLVSSFTDFVSGGVITLNFGIQKYKLAILLIAWLV